MDHSLRLTCFGFNVCVFWVVASKLSNEILKINMIWHGKTYFE